MPPVRFCEDRPKKTCMGSPEVADLRLSASETPYLFLKLPSHIYPSPDNHHPFWRCLAELRD